MTDLEFATCDLDKYSQVYGNKPRKFSELSKGDPIFCVKIEVKPGIGLFRRYASYEKFKLNFYKMELEEPDNPKGRKARIYLTERHGFVADKNVSAFFRYKRIYNGEISVQIYGTTLEECIYKAEKTTSITDLDGKLEWTIPNI